MPIVLSAHPEIVELLKCQESRINDLNAQVSNIEAMNVRLLDTLIRIEILGGHLPDNLSVARQAELFLQARDMARVARLKESV